MTSKILKYLFCLIMIFQSFVDCLYGQSLFSPAESDSSSYNLNIVNYGFNKIVNTYLFNGNANINMKVLGGEISLLQYYKGEKIKSYSQPFKDDENFNFKYSAKLFDAVSILTNQVWIYNSLSKVEEISSSAGLRYDFNKDFFIESKGGYRKSSLGDNHGTGAAYELNSGLKPIDVDGYIISANFNGEYSELNDRRNRRLMNFSGSFFKQYDQFNALRIITRYRSYLYPESFSDVDKTSIYNRLENTFSTNLNLDYSITGKILGSVGLNLENKDKYYTYTKYIITSPETGVEINRDELQLNIAGELIYLSDDFRQSLGMMYDIRNDRNSVKKINIMTDTLFNKLRTDRVILDNIGNTTQFRASTFWESSGSDTFNLNFLVSIFRYDTPSEFVNDDRDRFSNIINIKYSHKFSRILSASLEGGLYLEHLVYIKAEKSANNSWDRIIKFSPSVVIKTEKFSMNPSFKLQALYSVYDFEDISPGTESYSVREIAYADSIYVVLSRNINIQSIIRVRFFENSVFFWNAFSETPQDNQFDQFSKILISTKYNENYSFGCGLRFYLLRQKNISSYALNKSDVEHYSLAPEAIISVDYGSGIKMYLEGWYEFQKVLYDDSIQYKEIPNIFLNTSIQI